MLSVERAYGDVLNLRVIVKERTNEASVERGTKERGRGRVDAKVIASLLDVASKVAQALVVEDSAGAWRVYIGGANESNGFEL